MRARRHERDLHYRTDTHWNIHGCLLAYRLVCRACGARPRTDFLDRPFHEFEAVLDIGNKLDAPPLETVRNYDLFRDAERVGGGRLIDAYAAAGRLGELHSGAHAVYRNRSPDADPRILVLFGDSCANFAGNGLTAMLAETFREVHFIWSSNLDWGYVERILPDIVLCEQVERFLPRVPDDDFDLAACEAERLAALGGGGVAPSRRPGLTRNLHMPLIARCRTRRLPRPTRSAADGRAHPKPAPRPDRPDAPAPRRAERRRHAGQALVGLIETAFVAGLGTDALAGMALVFPVLMLVQMISAGAMGGGILSAVARSLGAGRRAEADRLPWYAAAIGLVLGLLTTGSNSPSGRRSTERWGARAPRSRRPSPMAALSSAARCWSGCSTRSPP